MMSAVEYERATLDEIEPHLEKLGYTLVRDPSSEQIPGFLGRYQPDAIAVGVKPSLAIEVLRRRGEAAELKLKQIRTLFEGQDDWQLDIYYASPDGAPLQPLDKVEIQRALNQGSSALKDNPQAAFLWFWAILEAIGRKLEPDLASRSLSPRSLIDVLVSNGHLTQSEGKRLRALGDMRNALAHGQLDKKPKAADLKFLHSLGERLHNRLGSQAAE